MTIDEAIKVLTEFRIPDPGEDFAEEDAAIGLGIEALKLVKAARDTLSGLSFTPLPGETLDEPQSLIDPTIHLGKREGDK